LPDVVDSATRSRMMSGIRSKNTDPELQMRRALHRAGFRYRLHAKDVPGRPDMVFPKYRAAVFINGCFWHGHDCSLFKMPGTRRDFWAAKIGRNRQRDAEVRVLLAERGWRCVTVWECATRGRGRIGLEETVRRLVAWLRDLTSPSLVLRSVAPGAA
jgi:DNA mismatch endonuclease (patch repair protein)